MTFFAGAVNRAALEPIIKEFEARENVTVNAVLPGYTRTERQMELATAMAQQTGQPAEEILESQASNVPMARLAEPAEIGEMIAFLSSEAAAYVTGQFLAVDGGYILST